MLKKFTPMPRYKIRRSVTRIMGIDPGFRSIGYGVIERTKNGRLKMAASGVLTESGDEPTYGKIAKRLKEKIKRWRPALIGLERLRFAKNEKTAMAVAETIGVMKYVIEEIGIPVKEFAPAEVKLAVTGYGNAGKKDVAGMVKVVLRMPNGFFSHHASDALAVAISAERFVPNRQTIQPLTRIQPFL